jgi:N-acetylglucosaminyl-diphospho-decaprenol L-rhamnosyltransferase
MADAVGLTLNYRDARRTLRCLRSLWAEGIDHVLVWDNSGDGGASGSELEQLAGADPRMELVVSPENLGFAMAVNRGLKWLADCHPRRPVLLVNNDAELHEGGLATMLRALYATPGAWLVYPDVDHGGRIVGTVYYHRLTGILQMHGKKLPGSFPYASGCCMLVNVEKSGTRLFDESFFMYGEDMEVGHRLKDMPGAMRHVPQTLVGHEGSASSGMASEFYETHIVACHFRLARVMAKNLPDLTLMFGMRWIVLSVRAVLRAVRYRSLSPVVALRNGWLLSK